MRRTLLALVATALLATGCQKGVTLWSSCDPAADPTGTDGTYVMVCRSGRWEPVMTVADYVKRANGWRETLTPVPPAPTTTAKGATTTAKATTTTTTTTTTIPNLSASGSFTVPAGRSVCHTGYTLSHGISIWVCQGAVDDWASMQLIVPMNGLCDTSDLMTPKVWYRPLLAASGTITQGSTVIPFDLTTAATASAGGAQWEVFDLADGGVTVDFDDVTLSHTFVCPA